MKISILKRCGVNKIRGFVALPIIIGSAILAVGVLGGLAYEYKGNQFIISVINKDKILAQLSGVTTPMPQTVCTAEYDPVCAQPPMPKCAEGMACIQVMPNPKTYSNECEAKNAGAVIKYNGECCVEENTASSDYGKSCCPGLIKKSFSYPCPAGEVCVAVMNFVCVKVITSPVKVITPNGGETLTIGTKYLVKNAYDGQQLSPYFRYALFKRIEILNSYSYEDLGALVGTRLNDESFEWEVGKYLTYTEPRETKIASAGSDYYIALMDNLSELDKSDAPFTITAPSTCVGENVVQYGLLNIGENCCPGLIRKNYSDPCPAGAMVCQSTEGSICVKADLICDATSKAVVDSVGGCSGINQTQYANIYQACCANKVTKETLLSMLNDYLADGVINSTEKTALLTALNSYLGQ